MTTTLPSQLVGGSKLKASADVQLVNRLGAALNDVVSATIFASTDGVLDDSDVQIAVMSKRLKLAAGKSKMLRVKLAATPDMPAGPFQLLARIERVNSGGTDVVATAGTFSVSTPFVDLHAAPPAVGAGTQTRDRKTRVTVAVSNLGNVASHGDEIIVLYARNGTSSIPLVSSPLRIKVAPGRTASASLSFTIPTSVTAGSYELVAVVSSAGVTQTIDDTLVGTPVTVV